MSFFVRGGDKSKLKRKNVAPKRPTNKGKKFKTPEAQEADDDEIDSDDEEELGESNAALDHYSGDENELETPKEKRLRLAKKYLEEIEKEEKAREDDKADFDDELSRRVKTDYLEKVGKLRKKVAESYKSYDQEKVIHLKHKALKLPITCLCLSTGGQYLFAGSKGMDIVKWDISKEVPVVAGVLHIIPLTSVAKEANRKKPKIPKIQIACLALSTDSKFLAVGDMSHRIRIYCPHTLTALGILNDHRDTVTAMVFRRDSHELYSTSKDRSVIVWSLDEMAKIEIMYGHQAAVTGIDALARDRAITSGGSDATIRIWKINEESQLVYNGHTGHSCDSVRLINEENFLSSGDDGSLCLWNAIKKKPLAVQPLAHGTSPENGQAHWITAIAAYVNTDLVASGSSDGFVRLWKLADNFRKFQQMLEIPVKGFVNSLVFTEDGKRLVAGVGQEHHLGRWWHLADCKNQILIIPLK